MLTSEQEAYLAAFADKGIAEQIEAEARQVELDKIYVPIEEAKQAVLAELTKQAQPLIDAGEYDEAQILIDSGLQDFATNTVPQMLVDAGVQSGT